MREETQTALHLWEKVIREDTQGERLDCRSYLEVRLEDVFSRSSDQFTNSYFLPKGIKSRGYESGSNKNEKHATLLKWAFSKTCRDAFSSPYPAAQNCFAFANAPRAGEEPPAHPRTVTTSHPAWRGSAPAVPREPPQHQPCACSRAAALTAPI